jgi:acetyl esterase/lipase
MRIRSILLFSLLLVLLALPGGSNAQQDTAGSAKKPETKSDTTSAPQPEKENWAVFDDLKTGLQAPTAAEFEHYEQAGFVRQLVRVQWRAADPIDLWVVLPKVTGKVPVVLYLYGNQETGERFRDNGWCQRVTAEGFAAVGFVSAVTDYRFRFRPLRQWFVSELPESLGTTVHDVQNILNYLALRDDIDMNHVGMFGMGSGATIAILAAHADPRIMTLDVLDPWGDWPEWLKSTPVISEKDRAKYLTPEFLKSVAPFDPVAYLPTLKTHNLRVQQTLSEPEMPKLAKEHLAAAVPNPNQLLQYGNANDLMKAWQTTGLSGWIKQQMRPMTPQVAAGGQVALEGKGSMASDIDSQGSTKEQEK